MCYQKTNAHNKHSIINNNSNRIEYRIQNFKKFPLCLWKFVHLIRLFSSNTIVECHCPCTAIRFLSIVFRFMVVDGFHEK